MATVHDPLGGYYAVDDRLLEEDAKLAGEVSGLFHGWYSYLTLRKHYSRQPSLLSGEQRSRLAYYDDLIKRIGGGV